MEHIHLIGIGGTGISSIARVLLEKGYTVSGSDRIVSTLATDLENAGVKVYEGHHPGNIKGADLVVRSSAIADDNVEVVAALENGIPVLKRSDFLGNLMENNLTIAVAGTNGKTTTSAMLAWTLTALNLDPSYIIGGISKNLANNAHAGKGTYFVIEADEYDRMFLGLNPFVILLTNVEYDHPDCFPTIGSYQSAFSDFVRRLKPGGIFVTNADQLGAANMISSLVGNVKAVTYGLSPVADYRASNIQTDQDGGMLFDVTLPGSEQSPVSVKLQVPGEHNISNALGVIAVNHQLGHSITDVALALSDFKGTGRRFDIIGEADGITIVDDYAHHPTKIQATLKAARLRFPGRRLVAVWQPHTYSRTRALEKEFMGSLLEADYVIVTDIFASREKPEPYSSRELVEKMNSPRVIHIPGIAEVSQHLLDILRPGDVLLVLSAGDADQISKTVLKKLSERTD